ncbi:hypothetical protein OUZ56_006948 [Daphnia magna]|uniref:Uncharacterized protein n=1 Tax=Daphnia magna TaxID=35525 RepID=A0ABQ9YX63_9CRUS|nr:hypothetical protein OUZ56_006948 [Daphnia magna]
MSLRRMNTNTPAREALFGWNTFSQQKVFWSRSVNVEVQRLKCATAHPCERSIDYHESSSDSVRFLKNLILL